MKDPFAALSGKKSGNSRHISRGGALHRKGERNSSIVPPFQESPRSLSPFQRNLFSLHCLDFHAEDRLQPWCHVGQPCGKSWWESVEGNPHPLIHATGSMTLLLPLWRKGHVHAPFERRTYSAGETPEVAQEPCQHWRGILTFRSRIHTRSLAPALKGEESREALEQFACGLSFPEATRAGPCGPRRKPRTPAATRENPGGFALQAR